MTTSSDTRVMWLGDAAPATWSAAALTAGAPLVEIWDLGSTLRLATLLDAAVVLVPAPHEALGTLAAALPHLALIAVLDEPADAPHALAAGAHDVILASAAASELALRLAVWRRHRGWRLGQAAARSTETALRAELAELAADRDRLRALAHQDELTGLGNRRSFEARLEYALGWAARYGGEVSVLTADCDGLKLVNDTLGHAHGDTALRAVADIMRASFRGVDHAARLGGDEFGVVMPATPRDAAAMVAGRLRARVADQVHLPRSLGLSISVGVASVATPRPAPQGLGEALLARADAAMYAAKRAGKNQVAVG